MTALLELMLSGFWSFVGSMIILWIGGELVVRLIINLALVIRGSPMVKKASDESIVRVVKLAIHDGQMDAQIARAVLRNANRGQPRK